MCSHREDLTRTWSAHGIKDHLTYMDFVKTQDLITFHGWMITKTEECLILAFWACTLHTRWHAWPVTDLHCHYDPFRVTWNLSLNSTWLISSSLGKSKGKIQEIHATGRRLIYYIIPNLIYGSTVIMLQHWTSSYGGALITCFGYLSS
jgi:hypothetical protein